MPIVSPQLSVFAHRIQQELSAKSADNQLEIEWKPNSGPQTDAYYSQADILGYGGAAGGGKTDLLLGLAAKEHHKAVIFRDTFPNLRAVIERSREILNAAGTTHQRDSYNESLHRWMLPDRQMIEFEACHEEKAKENQRGRPRDFYGFDEVTALSFTQFQFIIGWLRSTKQGQRCRIVMTFNPPTDENGGWIVDYFMPWLAYLHPNDFKHTNPAKPGELRWFTVVDGEEIECPDGNAFEYTNNAGIVEKLKPVSRTFIPAKLDDNPYLAETNYRAALQAQREPYRSQLLNGDFSKSSGGDPWQAIPTADYDRAVERWNAREGASTAPLNRIGVDVARGGKDNTVITPIHSDGYCGEQVKVPGALTPDGRSVAKLVYLNYSPQDVEVAVDVIGVGSSPVDVLREEGFTVVPMNGSGRAVVEEYGKEIPFTDEASGMKCVNLRSACVWNMRLLLEKDLIDLPPCPNMRRAALAHRWTPTAGGIKILSKDQVKELIGFSPDEWDSVMYGYWLKPPLVSVGLWEVGNLYVSKS